MSKTAVGLMARYPQLGQVKTRLAAKIGDQSALGVYSQLLDHSLSVLKSLDQESFERMVHVEPEESNEQFAKEFGIIDHQFGQAGTNLGMRMKSALESMFGLDGVNKGILIGADIPGLVQDIIEQARDLLDSHDLVFGPSEDGGYYLIGMNRTEPAIFEGPAWGSDQVLEVSLRIAKQAGLSVGLLDTLSDLDLYDDLKRFPEFSRFVV